MSPIIWVIICIATLVIGFVLGVIYRKKVAEAQIAGAEEEAKRIINDALKSAESKKREALVEAKEEIQKSRTEFEHEEKSRRAEHDQRRATDEPSVCCHPVSSCFSLLFVF